MTSHLRFVDVGFGYGERPVVEHVSLDLPRGGLTALIGPNGAGKTTLLHLACATLRPGHGRIELDGAELGAIPRSERARRIALVPQSLPIPFAFTVRELVGLGRTPHVRPFRGERRADHEAVERALRATDTARFAGRSVLDLSGGERQRAILALALAQEPELLLLDEPTANLDVAHQLAMLELLRTLNRDGGTMILAAIHDLNLAALYFDRLVVLHRGRIVADGPPRTVLTPELVESVYGSPVEVIDHPSEPVPLVALVRGPGARRG
ncbi:MAG TPA: ABC transporter ATP-binding protein [Chloroflexota bacterium]|nr:ABC transporter ATP-binding protein [Chloroflexota bacterium]